VPDVATQTDKAFVDLHAFFVSYWINSNLTETLRTGKVNENDLANSPPSTSFSCSLDVDRKD
jgi:hypothetical protein